MRDLERQRESARRAATQAFKEAKERLLANKKLIEKPESLPLQGMTLDQLLDYICVGEQLWVDKCQIAPKERKRKLHEICNNATELAKDLRDVFPEMISGRANSSYNEIRTVSKDALWTGALKHRFGGTLPENHSKFAEQDMPVPLWAYLMAMADFYEELTSNGPDFRYLYPPGLSKTNRRSVVLRHVKRVVRELRRDQGLQDTALNHDVLAADIAGTLLRQTVTALEIAQMKP